MFCTKRWRLFCFLSWLVSLYDIYLQYMWLQPILFPPEKRPSAQPPPAGAPGPPPQSAPSCWGTSPWWRTRDTALERGKMTKCFYSKTNFKDSTLRNLLCVCHFLGKPRLFHLFRLTGSFYLVWKRRMTGGMREECQVLRLTFLGLPLRAPGLRHVLFPAQLVEERFALKEGKCVDSDTHSFCPRPFSHRTMALWGDVSVRAQSGSWSVHTFLWGESSSPVLQQRETKEMNSLFWW